MIGQTVAHYRIESRLGSGGMGVVYRALDLQLKRPVALKFLPPHLSADEDAKQRFMQEAQAASALNQANICIVHHIGETDDGQLYIVMAFYDGQTLKYRLRDGALPEPLALDLARQMAAGLARAHEAGIVHRDIKPANIMVTDRDEVRILDFGVAKLESSADFTKAGTTVGTAAYMSPEQTRGGRVGPAADVWSLGVVLYEMLSGRRPFDAGYDQALAYAITNEEPAPIAGIAPETAALVRRMLAKDPAGRPADGSAALAALGGRADPAGGTATSPSPARDRAAQPSLARTVGLFAAGSITTLAIVYAAMIRFGLPDWVLTLGIVLLLPGLPVLVFATRAESRRAGLDSGERRSLSGLPSWITVRRAWIGGGLSMAGLVIVSAGWMGMRAAGVGPAGTLLTRGVLSESDRVIVAEFDDRSPDGTLGRTISQALRIDLAQSPVVSLMDDADVRSALERMQRDPSTRIDLAVAREVAQREGAKAIVAGEVAPLGSSYVISLRLLDAATGQELAPLRETAESDATIVQAVDRLSRDLRERIGESLRTIRAGAPLEQVTTSSLEALRLYTTGVMAFDRRDFQEAIQSLEAAIAIDSTFGMAYRKLAVIYYNEGRNREDQFRLSTRTYELRTRLPEKERFLAEAWYHVAVMRDHEAALRAYRAMLERFPNDDTALNNSAVAALGLGRADEAARYARQGIRAAAAPTPSLFENLVVALTDAGRLDEAESALDSLAAAVPDPVLSGIHASMLRIARTGDYPAELDSIDVLMGRATDAGVLRGLRYMRVRLAQNLGRLAEAERLVRSAASATRSGSSPSLLLEEEVDGLISRLAATGDRDAVAARLDALLGRIPLSGLGALDRPYSMLAYLNAQLGRTDETRRLLDEQARLWPEPWVRRDFLRYMANGLAALADEDAAAAVERIREGIPYRTGIGVGTCGRCGAYELGLALRAAGDPAAAAQVLRDALERPGALETAQDFGTVALLWRLLGDVSETLGRTDDAIRAYERFLALWADADPELQPQVIEVRARVDRLLAARSRESAGS
jgi:tetratricopeptide (TPR) repeat protein